MTNDLDAAPGPTDDELRLDAWPRSFETLYDTQMRPLSDLARLARDLEAQGVLDPEDWRLLSELEDSQTFTLNGEAGEPGRPDQGWLILPARGRYPALDVALDAHMVQLRAATLN